MSNAISVDLDDAAGQAKVDKLLAKFGNLQPLHATIGRVLVNRIRQCFRLGVDPWGTPWLALKMRKGQPLRDTGRLQRSVSATPDAQGVSVGTNVFYAPVQQFGATIVPVKAKRLVFKGPRGIVIFAKKVVVPPRRFMPLRRPGSPVELPPSWSLDAANAVKAYMRNAAKAAEGSA
jgi:phage gpG-like protein